ncbi:hypothetical protein [Pseudomarimonas salicorniae]|uniref:DUF481 domain-containing protein n=1 Tax=Pseudomarimonas salicorniae TaxID=2933270 RepID=A0ABT0GIR6_9GAMM|nr:hypothetical protein [Lysobacter sp. CAU 1642]MCK7594242.1 hypothetical protein [Lysobacter sp. CAU 1642]
MRWLPLLLLAAALPARGEGVLGERFSLAFGGFQNTLTLQGRVDDAVVEGTEIDFNDEFAFDNRRRLDLAELRFRAFDRHEFGIKAFRDARERRSILSETLRFDDQEFLVDAEAVGRVSFRSLEFDYTWWAWHDRDQAVGLQLGVIRFGASLSIRGRVAVDGQGEAEGRAAVSDRFFVPLAGIAWRRQLGPHWRLEAEARYLRRSYRGIEGEALSGHIGLEWLLGRHLSLVGQYGYTEVDVEQDELDLAGKLEVGFKGPQALLRLRF